MIYYRKPPNISVDRQKKNHHVTFFEYAYSYYMFERSCVRVLVGRRPAIMFNITLINTFFLSAAEFYNKKKGNGNAVVKTRPTGLGKHRSRRGRCG